HRRAPRRVRGRQHAQARCHGALQPRDRVGARGALSGVRLLELHALGGGVGTLLPAPPSRVCLAPSGTFAYRPPGDDGGGGRARGGGGGARAAVVASRALGVVREQVFAVSFGAGKELDAFITAFRIPNLLRDLLAEGALSAAFVTTFTHELERHGEAAAWRLASLVVNTLAVVVGGLCLLGICFAPAITRAIAPGFAEVPGKIDLTVHLTRIMFPFL